MDQLQEAQLNYLKTEIKNLQFERFQNELRVRDAGNETGNAAADEALKQTAYAAYNTMVMIDHKIKVRQAALAEMGPASD